MARIAVSTFNQDIPIAFYDNAKTWVIDEQERLHIVGDNGNLASYNRNGWATVQLSPCMGGPDLCAESEVSGNPSS